MEKMTLNVEGMGCDHCVKAISEALSELSGLTNVSVNLDSGTVFFEFDSSQTPLEKIKEAITEAGYTVA
jgi:copper chaperone